MLIGESVQPQEAALSLLLILLLTLGSIALIGSGAGGLFLANRALAPTRLAWANQQRFIADASHELRTPLTLLRADAEVLLRGRQNFDPEDAALLEDIVTKYNHTGGSVTIHTVVQGAQALLKVSDTGIGIASEHLSHLGERFYRVDKARSREAGGTGLGLSIARSIATMHAGKLTLSSIARQGTTVTIMLPLAAINQHDRDRKTTETRLHEPEQRI